MHSNIYMCIEIANLPSQESIDGDSANERTPLMKSKEIVIQKSYITLLCILLAVFASCITATLILSSRLLQTTCFKSTRMTEVIQFC